MNAAYNESIHNQHAEGKSALGEWRKFTGCWKYFVNGEAVIPPYL